MADQKTLTPEETQAARARNSRRGFLRTAGGVAAGTALFVAGCDNGGPLPGNQIPTASLSVGGLEDNMQDDLTVTFTATFDDDDLSGQDAFDESLTARIELSNGDAITGVNMDEPVSYTFDQRGEYTATLIVTDGGGARSRDTERFVVGAMEVEIDFSNDAGVLNYAYALEQLEAAFYAQVMNQSFDSAITDMTEQAYFEDLAVHEAIHRDFLEAALGDNAIPSLVPNFDSVDFTSRDSVLGTAQVLEDTGVSAYNGAADLLSDPANLVLAGKIVSVEARHASAVRDLIGGNQNFADLSDLTDLGADVDNALDVLQSPSDVLAAAGPFISTPLVATGL